MALRGALYEACRGCFCEIGRLAATLHRNRPRPSPFGRQLAAAVFQPITSWALVSSSGLVAHQQLVPLSTGSVVAHQQSDAVQQRRCCRPSTAGCRLVATMHRCRLDYQLVTTVHRFQLDSHLSSVGVPSIIGRMPIKATV